MYGGALQLRRSTGDLRKQRENGDEGKTESEARIEGNDGHKS